MGTRHSAALLLLLWAAAGGATAGAPPPPPPPPLTPVDLRVDGVRASDGVLVGLGHAAPRFSWALAAAAAAPRGTAQASATLTVADAPSLEPAAVVCAATVEGALATSAVCAGPAFSAPNAALWWRVCVTANDAGATVACSAVNALGTGLGPGDWTAGWVAAPEGAAQFPVTREFARPVRLRAVANASAALRGATVVRAVAFVASPAYYQLHVDGQRVSTHAFGSAGEFRARVLADAWDVTAAVAAAGAAPVVLGVRLGPGQWAHAQAFDATVLPLRLELHVDEIGRASCRER